MHPPLSSQAGYYGNDNKVFLNKKCGREGAEERGRGRRGRGEEKGNVEGGGGERGRKERREGGKGKRREKGGEEEERKEERGEEKGRKEGEGGTLHKLSQVSRLHCLQQLLWPRGEVRDNCTQVAMATAEPHTLTLNRTRGTTLLGGGKGERRRRRRRRKVSGYGRYEGVCDSMSV